MPRRMLCLQLRSGIRLRPPFWFRTMSDAASSTSSQAQALVRTKSVGWHWNFFSVMAIAAAAVVFVGFARTYYLSAWTGMPALPLLVDIHAMLFTTWIVFFFFQTALIATYRTALHKRLGAFGAVLAVTMVVVGYVTSIQAARRGFMGQFPNEPSGFSDPLAFLALGLGDILTFSILLSAAFAFRFRPETHKRLMLLATISLLPPAMTRFPFGHARLPVALVALLCFLLAGPVYDRKTRGRVSPAFKWGGLLILVSTAFRPVIGNSGGWHVLAHWLVR